MTGAPTQPAATLPQLLRRNAVIMAGRPAIREKSRGIWQTFTWAQVYDEVRDFAAGLAAHGFGRGDKLAVIGDNRPRLYWAQVDKILSLKAQLPNLELVVYDDVRGMRHYAADCLKSFDEIKAAGRDFAGTHAGYVEAEIDRTGPDDLALITYTSGTTGHPKGVMLSHANLLSSAEAFVGAEDLRATDELLCYLPMAWIGDSLFALVLTLLVGFTCNCPERPDTVQRDLRELGPTIALAPPRVWENMLTQLRVRTADSSPLKRKVFDYFRHLAERAELLKGGGQRLPPLMRLGLALG